MIKQWLNVHFLFFLPLYWRNTPHCQSQSRYDYFLLFSCTLSSTLFFHLLMELSILWSNMLHSFLDSHLHGICRVVPLTLPQSISWSTQSVLTPLSPTLVSVSIRSHWDYCISFMSFPKFFPPQTNALKYIVLTITLSLKFYQDFPLHQIKFSYYGLWIHPNVASS